MPDSIRYTCKHPGCPRRFDTREDAPTTTTASTPPPPPTEGTHE